MQQGITSPQRRHHPSVSPVAGNYLTPHPSDVDDEAILSRDEFIALSPERRPCQNWHEYFDPTSGKLRRTLWPCNNKCYCPRCIDLRIKEVTDRIQRGITEHGQVAISVVSKAEATRHLRRAKKTTAEYFKYPACRDRVLLTEDPLDAIEGSILISSLDEFTRAIPKLAYHSLRTLIRLTPKRRRLSGALGKEAKEVEEEDGGNGSQAKEATVVVKITTVSLTEPSYPDTLSGQLRKAKRQTTKRAALLAALMRTKDLDPQDPKSAVKACNRRADVYCEELIARDIKAQRSRQKVRIEGHLMYNWKSTTQCLLSDARNAPARPDPPKKYATAPAPAALAA